MRKRNYKICLVIILLFSTLILACGWFSGKQSAPTLAPPTVAPIKPNQEAAQRAAENFNQAVQESTNNHPFEYRINNEEVTSIVADLLQKRADIPFSEPQIWFTNNKIYVTGMVDGFGPKPMPAYIEAVPKVVNNQVIVNIEKAKVGSFNLPQSASNSFSETITQSLAEAQLNIQVNTITILEGEILIQGTMNSE